MNQPILSVLIDTYNHERYIEQAVVSAIEQDFPASDYEILVVDDGSTDRTAEIVRKFAPRVRLLTKKNGGQASAFNAGFQEVRGEIIALLDGDDWFAQGKLTAVTKALEQNPTASAVGHGYYEFDGQTKEVKLHAPERRKFLSLATPDDARDARAEWPFLLIGALTVRRKVLEKVIPISDALIFCADGPIAWTAMAMGVFIFEEPLCYYRHHADNLHALDAAASGTKMRRKFDMGYLMLEEIERVLIRLGVSSESLRASFYPDWIGSVSGLRIFGGSRVRTFQMEMRLFRMEHQNPTLSYRLFKYLGVGAATFLLSTRHYYKLKDWYGRRNLGRLRDRLFKAARHV